MSIHVKIKSDAAIYAGITGVITKKIPGDAFYIVHLDNGKTSSFHETEFDRLGCSKPIFKEESVN